MPHRYSSETVFLNYVVISCLGRDNIGGQLKSVGWKYLEEFQCRCRLLMEVRLDVGGGGAILSVCKWWKQIAKLRRANVREKHNV